ncbi:hypothetical protein SPRG_05996 [Saprolegnia parasitica CBS 223.65]|uniref:START domain-containing protein n=1 Tax=Saprolegnia parasitica (strain CBS 223.65) TaxID=695850 RepID=A0A067CG18_SAPPC|nr:hypothetical protein SPRG_05996 [Saprolegnia parasitica CBS 223.65]KDO29458.1 hypothetical protein SPRG_05996 [Saprolegnia parasitica CBS 223.65]|eukprot:XP_012199957.1 hypothetical protein SPRG_05996 [Saprolegnia parasitica CBS 223.65]
MESLTSDDEAQLDAAIVDSLLSAPAHYQKKQRAELAYLRSQVALLSTHLDALASARYAPDVGHWERTARNQKIASQRAFIENTRLKRVLEDQLELAGALEKLLVKRPRLAALPLQDVADWKLRRLPSEPTRRAAAFHAMLDDAHTHLETLLVRTSILDAPIGHRRLSVHEVDDSIRVSMQSVADISKDFVACSDAIWSRWHGQLSASLPHVRMELIEDFGASGVYVQLSSSLDTTSHVPCVYIMYAIKRFIFQDRIVFVLKTVLEDVMHPPPPGQLVGNHNACILVQAAGANRTIRRMVVEGRLPAEAPQQNPLFHSPGRISDAVLKLLRSVFDELEATLS